MAEEIISKSFSQIFSLFEPTCPTLSKFLKDLESSLYSINLEDYTNASSITKKIEEIMKEVPGDLITTRPSTLPSATLFTKSQLKRLDLIYPSSSGSKFLLILSKASLIFS